MQAQATVERLRMPGGEETLAQDEEWCEVVVGGELRRIRFHDYAELYEVPGLYERLFYDELGCCSPQTVVGLLADDLRRSGEDPADLEVLDIGAGNGMVGEELAGLGAGSIVGVDIVEEAARAVERDRPGVYDDYVVTDLTDMGPAERATLGRHRFTCLTSVAALGFGDIPPEAFAAAYELIEPEGRVAFTIKEDFLADEDPSGFASLIRQMLDEGILALRARRRYRHRLSCQGRPLHYVAMLAHKAGGLEAPPA